MKPPLLVHGMHGLGDNLHQRAIIRQLMVNYEVWLESSWVSVYHDLVTQGLHVIRRSVNLRTQMKNQSREHALFAPYSVPHGCESVRIMYHGADVQRQSSQTILQSMCESAGHGVDYDTADYRLPCLTGWMDQAQRIVGGIVKPICIYRPLVVRPEWQGNAKRNADPQVYAELFAAIRDCFYVISVADLAPEQEWITGPRLRADLELHKGELSFEGLAALFHLADLVYTSSGFGTVLAPAVGTPVISVVGGYERAVWHSSGARFAPYLGIEPIHPCACATSACRQQCNKTTDIPRMSFRMIRFMDDILGYVMETAETPFDQMFAPAEPEPVAMRRMPSYHMQHRFSRIGLKA